MKMKNTLVIVFVILVGVALAQDCKVRGKTCADHEQCCGGCCFNGECIDTYRSCLSPFDVCRDHSCIGEENCYPYTPPECPGCEPIPVCKILDV